MTIVYNAITCTYIIIIGAAINIELSVCYNSNNYQGFGFHGFFINIRVLIITGVLKIS